MNTRTKQTSRTQDIGGKGYQSYSDIGRVVVAVNTCALASGTKSRLKYILEKKNRIHFISSSQGYVVIVQNFRWTDCRPKRPDRLWGSPSLLCSGYPYSLPCVKWRFVKIATHFSLVLQFKMGVGTYTAHIGLLGLHRDHYAFT